MTFDKIVEVVGLLADGYDPVSGETLPDNHLLHERDCVTALSVAHYVLSVELGGQDGKLSAADEGVGTQRKRPMNAGKSWTKEAEDELIRRYKSGESIGKLAKHFDRTSSSIRIRLTDLTLKHKFNVP